MRDTREIREEIRRIESLIQAGAALLRDPDTTIHRRISLTLRKSQLDVYLHGLLYALGDMDSLEGVEDQSEMEPHVPVI
jgi:hypothetical protein